MYRVGVDNQMLDPRQLLILDEAHNLERKMLMLSSHLLNREYISTKFGIDIFEALMKGEKSYNHIKSESDYWIDVCKKLMKACGENIEKIGGKGKEVQVTLDEFESDLKEFNSIRLGLESKDLIIDVPDFKSIKKIKWIFQQNLSHILFLMLLKIC